MTVLEHAAASDAETDDDVVRFASWPARAWALVLDVLPGLAVIATMALSWLTVAQGSWQWWTFTTAAVVVAVAMAVNRWVLPSLNGSTVGRAAANIRLVRHDGGQPGVGRLLARDAAHLLDTATLFVGWLWPLWDGRNRTFADLLLRTESRAIIDPTESSRRARRIAGTVLVAAAVSSAAGSGVAYLTVWRHDRAVETARSQIAEQGPRIVEEILSYHAESIVDDFAKAQSLATDGYRPQLIAQQQAVQKVSANAAGNDYWAVSSAVVSADVDRAAMLIALQGQRGSRPEELKFITATVRVDFQKADDQWRVGNLVVLKKPLMGRDTPGGGQ